MINLQVEAARTKMALIVCVLPDGLCIKIPVSPALLREDPKLVGPELLRMIQDAEAEFWHHR